MNVDVDRDLCEANGICVAVAPAVFSLDDDDQLHIDNGAVGDNADGVEAAVHQCPKQALSLEE